MERRERLFSVCSMFWAPCCSPYGAAHFPGVRLRRYRIRDLKRLRSEVPVCTKSTRALAHLPEPPDHDRFGRDQLRHGLLGRSHSPLPEVPWNLPERKNFQRNIFLTVLCYLAKCLPVNGGEAARSSSVSLTSAAACWIGSRACCLSRRAAGRGREGSTRRISPTAWDVLSTRTQTAG